MIEDVDQGRTFEILSAEPIRRRRKPKFWSDEDKALILEQALSPGANISAVTHAHGVDLSQLFGWRRVAPASGLVRRLDLAAGRNETFARLETIQTDLVEI